MVKKKVKNKVMNCDIRTTACSSCGSGIYGLGFIGALVYYLSHSNGFWMGIWGIIKALVWPAFLVYELLKFTLA